MCQTNRERRIEKNDNRTNNRCNNAMRCKCNNHVRKITQQIDWYHAVRIHVLRVRSLRAQRDDDDAENRTTTKSKEL
jgi:transcription elongation factor Elf1